MAKSNFIKIDTSQVDAYIKHLNKMDYRGMNNGASSIVRQVANDVKSDYKAVTPKRDSKKKSGKYGATGGNLQRSLRVFRKKQRNPFIIEYSVGYKTHSYGQLAAKIHKGQKVTDGYYGWMVNYGVAGRGKGKKDYSNQNFIKKARDRANITIGGKLSNRVTTFLTRKLEKELTKRVTR
jgi:hypothetical protein